ncbi:hypothetical protein sos41_13630 [Alphaproteobacteria bacterium SO-S41]|nr:hypothetical protein sos41_13630 [Alphaproteobacteria bacterium SO-S41]
MRKPLFFQRFATDERGAAAIIFALTATVLLTMTAFAVDFGYLYVQNRRLQGLADLAAMAAAEDLPNARRRVDQTIAANGWPTKIEAQIVLGSYVPDSTVESGQRFSPGGSMPNAVQVKLKSNIALFFGEHLTESGTVTIARSATAANAQLAAFSLGTRLVSLNGGVANALLTALTGSKVSLSVMDYNSLLAANVSLFDYVDALRTELNLEGASFDKVLASDIETSDALSALGTLLEDKGDKTAAFAVRQLATASGALSDIGLDKLIDLGAAGAQDHTGVGGMKLTVNALDLSNAVLALARDGRQVKLDFKAAIPGLASVQAWLAIGERPNNSPWIAVTASGEPVIRTAQARLYVVASVGTGASGKNAIVSVNLPLLVELASAEAKLGAISCPANARERKVTLQVKTGIGRAAIAAVDMTKLDDFKHKLVENPAALVALPLVSVTAQAGVDVGGKNWQTLSFNGAEIDAHAIKTVQTNDALQAVTTSLIGDLKLKVNILGLGLPLGAPAIQQSVAAALGTAAAPLDAVVNSLTGLLGLHLGEADVRINGVRCHSSALVL